MGGYADDLFNIFYRMERRAMVREGFAYGGQGRRDFQEQYGVLGGRREDRRLRQCLLAGHEEDCARPAQARGFAAPVRQVPDEHDWRRPAWENRPTPYGASLTTNAKKYCHAVRLRGENPKKNRSLYSICQYRLPYLRRQ
jgi:hypothetical protein